MATRSILIDDIDGSEGDVHSVNFSLDGADYRIDLGPKNLKKFADAMATYVEHAEKVGGSTRKGRAKSTRAASNKEELAAIRAWARDSGYTVSDRGRISAEIVDAYNAAP